MICPRCHKLCSEQGCQHCGWRRSLNGEVHRHTLLPAPSVHPTPAFAPASTNAAPLEVGELLRNGSYRLIERLSWQNWLPGVSETTWLAEDCKHYNMFVRLCEVMLSEKERAARRALFATATRALHAAGKHPHLPTLLDMFEEGERGCFVFERTEGESLLARMRRIRRVLSEQEVIDCCLQVVDILEYLEQQAPPIVHGLIQPEHILLGRTSGRFMLTSGSIILALHDKSGGYIAGVSRTQLSPYAAPEFGRGLATASADLYALVATAYFLATGQLPVKKNGIIPTARQYNSYLSPQLETILERGLYSGLGLRPDTSLRYQRPSELRWDILTTCVPAPVG
jgi:serine/threonine protein kinase